MAKSKNQNLFSLLPGGKGLHSTKTSAAAAEVGAASAPGGFDVFWLGFGMFWLDYSMLFCFKMFDDFFGGRCWYSIDLSPKAWKIWTVEGFCPLAHQGSPTFRVKLEVEKDFCCHKPQIQQVSFEKTPILGYLESLFSGVWPKKPYLPSAISHLAIWHDDLLIFDPVSMTSWLFVSICFTPKLKWIPHRQPLAVERRILTPGAANFWRAKNWENWGNRFFPQKKRGKPVFLGVFFFPKQKNRRLRRRRRQQPVVWELRTFLRSVWWEAEGGCSGVATGVAHSQRFFSTWS